MGRGGVKRCSSVFFKTWSWNSWSTTNWLIGSGLPFHTATHNNTPCSFTLCGTQWATHSSIAWPSCTTIAWCRVQCWILLLGGTKPWLRTPITAWKNVQWYRMGTLAWSFFWTLLNSRQLMNTKADQTSKARNTSDEQELVWELISQQDLHISCSFFLVTQANLSDKALQHLMINALRCCLPRNSGWGRG